MTKKDFETFSNKLFSRLDQIEYRLDRVEKRLDNVEKNIKEIKHRLDRIENCPTIKKELSSLN